MPELTDFVLRHRTFYPQFGILTVERSVRKVNFGIKLKKLRTQMGLSQKILAERLGVTKSVISYYESQERSPSPDVLIRCSRIFHVSTDYLLGLDQKQTIDISDLEEEDVAILRRLADRMRKTAGQTR